MKTLEELEQPYIAMGEQIQKLKEEAKPKKWEWSYDDTCYVANSWDTHKSSGRDNDFLEHGRYRRTEKQAEYSLLRNKRANRLEALAMEIGGLYEWNIGSNNYYVYFTGKTWLKEWNENSFMPEKVYMSEETANTICKMLNEGTYSLDGEL